MSISGESRGKLRMLMKEFNKLDEPTQTDELKVWCSSANNIIERDRKDRMMDQELGSMLNGR